jgi:hypothetical protein
VVQYRNSGQNSEPSLYVQLKVRNMNWLINRKLQLSLENKITIYRAIIKPVWTYGIELWGCSNSLTQKFSKRFNPKR